MNCATVRRYLVVFAITLSCCGSAAYADDHAEDSLAFRVALDSLIYRVEQATLHKDTEKLTGSLTDSAVVTVFNRTVTGQENAKGMLDYFFNRFIDVSLNVQPEAVVLVNDSAKVVGDAVFSIKYPMIDPRAWHLTFEAGMVGDGKNDWKVYELTVPRPLPDTIESGEPGNSK